MKDEDGLDCMVARGCIDIDECIGLLIWKYTYDLVWLWRVYIYIIVQTISLIPEHWEYRTSNRSLHIAAVGLAALGNPTSESHIRGCNRSSGCSCTIPPPLSGFWLAASRLFIPFYISRWCQCTTTPGECRGGWLFYYWRWDFQENIPTSSTSHRISYELSRRFCPWNLWELKIRSHHLRSSHNTRFFCSKKWKSLEGAKP